MAICWHELSEEDFQDLEGKRGTFVDEGNENFGHKHFNVLGEAERDQVEYVTEDSAEELVGSRYVTDQNDRFNRGQRLEKIEVFVVVRGIRSTQTSRELAEEELEDILRGLSVLEINRNRTATHFELWCGIWCVRCVETEQVGDTTCSECPNALVLVQEHRRTNELLPHALQGIGIHIILVDRGELCVQSLQHGERARDDMDEDIPSSF